jgi:hypothetical protein
MQVKFTRQEFQASGRKSSHLFGKLIWRDLNEAVRYTYNDGLF